MTAKNRKPVPVDLSALHSALDRLATLQPDTVAALSAIVRHIVGDDDQVPPTTGKVGA
jgi:hypothetical protein